MAKLKSIQGLDPDVIEKAMANGEKTQQHLNEPDEVILAKYKERSMRASVFGEFKRTQNILDNKNYVPINLIPSKYRLDYNNVLEVRSLTVQEVKRLADIDENNSIHIMNDIISKCCKNVPIDEMYLGDRLFLILWIRYNTFPNAKYKVPFTCPKCGDSTFHFKMDNLNVDYLDDGYDPELEILTNKGDTIRLSHLKVKHEKEIERFKNKKEIRIQYTEQDLDTELLALASMITEINGKSTLIERESVVDGDYSIVTNLSKTFPFVIDGGLDTDDFVSILSYIQKYKIGINPVMHVTCEKCAGEFPMGFMFSPQFFIPQSEVRTNIRN